MTSLFDKVRQSLTWKKSATYCAARIGISVEDYLVMKNQLTEEAASPEDLVVTGIVSVKENLDSQTKQFEAIATTEPKTPEEIIALLNIYTTKWKLSQYWNKQKKDHWLVSALVTAIKPTQENIIEEVLRNFNPQKVEVHHVLNLEPPKAIHSYCGVFSVQDIHFGKEGNEQVIQDFKAAIIDVCERTVKSHHLYKLIYFYNKDQLQFLQTYF